MSEIELKFVLDEGAPKRLRARAKALVFTAGPTKTRTLRSIYWDTPEHALEKAGISLRLRRDGRRWTQTVKTTAKPQEGLAQVGEFENPAPGGRLCLETIPDDSIRDKIAHCVKGSSLQPVCETEVKRTTSELSLEDGTRAELAIDVAVIRAGGRSAELREAEIELIEGNPRRLFDIAYALFPAGGLTFSRLSKAARGYLLAKKGQIDLPLMARTAGAVALYPCQTAEQAARDILRECFDQIATNMMVVRELDDPEGPHELRVGLRRLQSAFSALKPVFGSPEMSRLQEEAQWLRKQVGDLRDLDVVVNEFVMKEAQAYPDEPGLSALGDALRQRATERRQSLGKLLAAARAQSFILDLARLVETRGWLVPEDFSQTERLAAPVADVAGHALKTTWKKVRKKTGKMETFTPEQRHELRKELKKLRYMVEFFSPLFGKKSADPFRKRLQKLQTVLGALNDAVMVKATLTGTEAEVAKDQAMQRATGWVVGASQARAEFGWTQAMALWRDLEATRPFWK